MSLEKQQFDNQGASFQGRSQVFIGGGGGQLGPYKFVKKNFSAKIDNTL